MSDLKQGWGFPLNSRKAHYFIAGEITSICGKMMYSGTREDDNHNSRDNCAECIRRREKSVKKIVLCEYTGLERLPSGNGLTLTSCCHEDSGASLPAICEIENQHKCEGYNEVKG